MYVSNTRSMLCIGTEIWQRFFEDNADIVFVMQDPTRSEEVKVEDEDESDFMCVMTGNTLPFTHKIRVRFWGLF